MGLYKIGPLSSAHYVVRFFISHDSEGIFESNAVMIWAFIRSGLYFSLINNILSSAEMIEWIEEIKQEFTVWLGNLNTTTEKIII